MKKLLVVLVALLTVSLFAAVPVTISGGGKVQAGIYFDNAGFRTELNIWDTWIGFSIDQPANLSIYVTDHNANGIGISMLSLSNDHLGATWYANQAFTGNGSLWWFVDIDDGAWAPTAVLELKDLGLFVATQDNNKVAAKLVVDPLTVAAQASFAGYSFAGAGAEVSAEDIFAGLGFRAAFRTPGDYQLHTWFKNTLGPVDVDAYFAYGTINDQVVGVNFGLTPVSMLNITGNLNYDIAGAVFSAWLQGVLSNSLGSLTLKYIYPATAQFMVAPTPFTFGPATLTLKAGSGDYNNWPNGLDGDVVANFQDVSFTADLCVAPTLGLMVISDPTIALNFGYYLLTGGMSAGLNVTTALYDLLNVEFGLDFFNLPGWYLNVYYYQEF
ncbi:hypothetical protein AT15_07345 [Kosmotoga arenicorallina S304]|uniref:Uncharacterized protein n=1 Tax=Kosmotoga arenicorallina S304 TaxID=1453497 RepID=A0A176K2X7_9BACT|nr:hypothetical protein [Kosmotoga arenicorallina]OAA31303.1 hypothetical protein AT15_07345 [Kosmotoga arenicorallina S304]